MSIEQEIKDNINHLSKVIDDFNAIEKRRGYPIYDGISEKARAIVFYQRAWRAIDNAENALEDAIMERSNPSFWRRISKQIRGRRFRGKRI